MNEGGGIIRPRRFLHPSRIVLVLAAAAALVGGFVLATSVFGGGDSPGVLQIPVPVDPRPSESLRLLPGDAEFEAFPFEFADFPIYWVGEEFGGHSLRNILRQIVSPEDGLVAQDTVKFLYGNCGAEKLTDGGCPFPLAITIQPYCIVPPELIGDGTRPINIEKVRGGADALMVGGGLRLWTGDVTVKIYASSPQLLEDATTALASPNGLGPAGVGDALPAPERDCSAYEMVPHPAKRG